MNPGLVLLPALSFVGWAFGRRRLAIAWMLVGLAGCILLAPSLLIPDGIPSSAALIARDAPWHATASAADGNVALRDVAYQIQPWLLYLRHQVRQGRLAFWNPYQSSGTPFWGNGQSAPLFPLNLLFVALPLNLGFLLLPWLRFLVAGLGAWALARRLGMSDSGALVAALIFPLSGMMVSFLLFPMGNALALLPWIFWSVAGIVEGKGSWLCLAPLVAVQALGGHPGTLIHTALLTTIFLALTASWRKPRAWLHFAAGWGVGVGVAGAALLPLWLTLVVSSRWGMNLAPTFIPPTLLLKQTLRLVLPDLYGNPALGTWWGPFNYNATAVYAGAVALPFALAGVGTRPRDRRWLALAALTVFCLLAAFHLAGIANLYGRLPILRHVPIHRLLMGVELGLSLLAARGFDSWSRGDGRWLTAGAAIVLGMLGASWFCFARSWQVHHQLSEQIGWTIFVAGSSLFLLSSLRFRALWRQRMRWGVLALICADLVVAHGAINPPLSLRRLFPETPAVRFLQAHTGRVAGIGPALHPNAAMVYGLFDVRGDDPIKLERYAAVYAKLAQPGPIYFRPIRDWSSPWLDRLGVRWVIAAPHQPPPIPTWRIAYSGRDAVVFARPSAEPIVRWAHGADRHGIQVKGREPGRWVIDFSTARRRRMVVAEAWDRGWRASVDGKRVAVAPERGLLLGVDVGPGSGELVLRYLPPGIKAGAILSLLGLLAILAGGGERVWKKRRGKASDGTIAADVRDPRL